MALYQGNEPDLFESSLSITNARVCDCGAIFEPVSDQSAPVCDACFCSGATADRWGHEQVGDCPAQSQQELLDAKRKLKAGPKRSGYRRKRQQDSYDSDWDVPIDYGRELR